MVLDLTHIMSCVSKTLVSLASAAVSTAAASPAASVTAAVTAAAVAAKPPHHHL